MTPEEIKTEKKMKSIKAAWDKAPGGRKKDEALKHYRAAEKSHTARNEVQANKELDAAMQALALRPAFEMKAVIAQPTSSGGLIQNKSKFW